MEDQKRVRYAWVRSILYVSIVVYGISGCISEMRAIRSFRQTRDWPRADAIVDSAQAYWKDTSWHGYRHCARLHYRYSVNGVELKGTNQVFDFGCWPDGDTVVADHKPGTHIQIAYNPSAPDITIVPSIVVAPEYPWISIAVILVCLILLLWESAGLWRSFAPRHR